jgi:hypothetical protein
LTCQSAALTGIASMSGIGALSNGGVLRVY